MELLLFFLKSTVVVPLTLLPIINPLAGAPIFLITAGADGPMLQRLARQVAFNGWVVLVVSMLVGSYVLELFGISLPIVRVAGGMLVASAGWRMLHTHDDDEVRNAVAQSQPTEVSEAELVKRSFFPITFPLTTGPGSIAAAIALGAKTPGATSGVYVVGALVAVVGSALTALVIYGVYAHSAKLMSRLGDIGGMVMTRLMAFVLLCIGIEIIWAGVSELIKPLAG